jgi:hypothetical protein
MLLKSPSSGGGGATPSVGGEQRQLKALNDIKRQFDEKIMRFDMQIQEYLKLGNKLSDFLKVLKEREALIIDYFYKCFNFRNGSSSVRNSGFGTSAQLQDDLLFTLFDAMKDQTAALSRYHMR